MSPFANPAMGDILTPGHYGAILMDPPWQYLTYSGAGTPHRTEVDHYEVMSLADLQALPVADLAAKDCLLVMWVIGSHLDQALALGKHYGFKYSTDGFVWVKTGKHDPAVRPISLGHWSRKQTEYVLLFTRGKPKRLARNIRQLFETDGHIIYAPKREHSRKPDDTHDRVQRLTGGPYVELFARERRPGWHAWGKEVGKFDVTICSHFVLDLPRNPIWIDDPELAELLDVRGESVAGRTSLLESTTSGRADNRSLNLIDTDISEISVSQRGVEDDFDLIG